MQVDRQPNEIQFAPSGYTALPANSPDARELDCDEACTRREISAKYPTAPRFPGAPQLVIPSFPKRVSPRICSRTFPPVITRHLLHRADRGSSRAFCAVIRTGACLTRVPVRACRAVYSRFWGRIRRRSHSSCVT